MNDERGTMTRIQFIVPRSSFLPDILSRVSQTPTNRLTCLFSGRVQGVGFRYTVQNLAMRYDVGGYVRNTPDGRVELVMEGPDEEMQHLLDVVKERMDGFIRKTTCDQSAATGEFTSFTIRH